MNTLRDALHEYLVLRRSMGYKMHDAGVLLPRFVSFMEERRAEYITVRLALEWVQQAKTVQLAEWVGTQTLLCARLRSSSQRRTVPSG